MKLTISSKTLALLAALGLFCGIVLADDHGGMENPVTEADEAAEAMSKKAEAEAEAAVAKDEEKAKEATEMQAEEVGGVD